MAYGTNLPRHTFFYQPPRTEEDDKRLFENAMRVLEADIMSIGMHLAIDSDARHAYSKEIAAMSSELRSQVRRGRITWRMAAEQAQETRNVIMEISRKHSTPVGRAVAESLKLKGKTMDELIKKYTRVLFGEHTDFHNLNARKKNEVYAAIVESSGGSRPNVSKSMDKAGPTARGVIIISLAISVYTVANAEDKLQAASREVAINGASVVGAFSGGALAGLACGPAAPICVSIGAFVGGTLAAFGTSFLW